MLPDSVVLSGGIILPQIGADITVETADEPDVELPVASFEVGELMFHDLANPR